MSHTAVSLIRFGLLAGLAVVAVVVVALHGMRGLELVGALGLVVLLVRSQAWRSIEGVLARLTGSRARAYGLVLGTIIVVFTAVNIVELVR